MKEIPDKSIDMILCDLPYGTTACSWDIIIPFDKLWEQYKRIIKNKGAIVLFGSQPFTSKLILSNINDFSHIWIWVKNKSSNFQLANKMPLKITEDIIVFYFENDINYHKELREYFYNEKIKSGLTNKQINELLGYSIKGSGMAGHYFKKDKIQFSIPKEKDYLKLQETGFFSKSYKEILKQWKNEEKTKRTYNPQNIEKLSNKIIQSNINKAGKLGHLSSLSKRNEYQQIYTNYPNNILKFDIPNKNIHPTQKPVELLKYLVKTYTNENEIVLDNCMGSGSTGIACIQTNRNFIGYELEKSYFEIAEKRINEELNKPKLF